MRSFYTVAILFILMLFSSFYNCIYIRNISDELMQACDQLDPISFPELSAKKAQEIKDRWESQRKFVQITIHHTEIEFIDNAIDELCAYAQYGSEADFHRARRLAINALEELRQSETLFPTNIL